MGPNATKDDPGSPDNRNLEGEVNHHEVGRTTNPIRQIGKITYSFLTAEAGSSSNGDEAEADAIATKERHGHNRSPIELTNIGRFILILPLSSPEEAVQTATSPEKKQR